MRPSRKTKTTVSAAHQLLLDLPSAGPDLHARDPHSEGHRERRPPVRRSVFGDARTPVVRPETAAEWATRSIRSLSSGSRVLLLGRATPLSSDESSGVRIDHVSDCHPAPAAFIEAALAAHSERSGSSEAGSRLWTHETAPAPIAEIVERAYRFWFDGNVVRCSSSHVRVVTRASQVAHALRSFPSTRIETYPSAILEAVSTTDLVFSDQEIAWATDPLDAERIFRRREQSSDLSYRAPTADPDSQLRKRLAGLCLIGKPIGSSDASLANTEPWSSSAEWRELLLSPPATLDVWRDRIAIALAANGLSIEAARRTLFGSGQIERRTNGGERVDGRVVDVSLALSVLGAALEAWSRSDLIHCADRNGEDLLDAAASTRGLRIVVAYDDTPANQLLVNALPELLLLARANGHLVTVVLSRTRWDGRILLPPPCLVGRAPQTQATRLAVIARNQGTPAPAAPLVTTIPDTSMLARDLEAEFEHRFPITRLSVTSLGTFLRDPQLFVRRHCLGLVELDHDRPSKKDELSHADFGSLAHEVLARFAGKGAGASVEYAEIEAHVLDIHADLSREKFGDKRTPCVELQLRELARRLRKFALWQAQWTRRGYRIVESELKSELPFDDLGITIHGRIDRVDVNTITSERVVIDYKFRDRRSSARSTHIKRTHRLDERAEYWIDLQLPLYAHMQATGEWPTLALLDLPTEDSSPSRAPLELSIADFSDEELLEARQVARGIATRVRAMDVSEAVRVASGEADAISTLSSEAR